VAGGGVTTGPRAVFGPPIEEDTSVEWYTPPFIFDALGLEFDLDPASPEEGPVPWVPAKRFITPTENGLWLPWEGRVWLNPPYGRWTGPFLERLVAHGDGIALVFARTDTRWAQATLPAAAAVCFIAGRIPFVSPVEGADRNGGGPGGGAGSMLMGFGDVCAAAVRRCGLGWVTATRAETGLNVGALAQAMHDYMHLDSESECDAVGDARRIAETYAAIVAAGVAP
jgi:DNA N-6-adenine-methyltransferase (Dam)